MSRKRLLIAVLLVSTGLLFSLSSTLYAQCCDTIYQVTAPCLCTGCSG